MNYLLFFLLFPLIYEVIVGILYFKYGDIDLYFDVFDSEAMSSILLTLIFLAIDYLIEFIYFFICEKVYKEDILLVGYEQVGIELKAFVIFLIIFAIGHLMVLIYNIIDWGWFDFPPYFATIIFVFSFAIFCFVITFTNKIILDRENFDNIEYTKEESCYVLNSIKDDFNQDFYLKISYNDEGYNIYYSYIDEDGKTCFDIISYNKNKTYLNDTISIFEKENCLEPNVKIVRNYKEINNEIYEYFDYEFQIPSNSIKNMEISNE